MFMDACHCPGAVMILFRGKMGTVFHTGDFRFSESMFNNEVLFPREKRNKEMKGISIDVDYLFLDNTFANPEYDFPSREEAY
jgi:DNA cross-link repair 1B protein